MFKFVGGVVCYLKSWNWCKIIGIYPKKYRGKFFTLTIIVNFGWLSKLEIDALNYLIREIKFANKLEPIKIVGGNYVTSHKAIFKKIGCAIPIVWGVVYQDQFWELG